jgi:type 1 glutamine amidotransferase
MIHQPPTISDSASWKPLACRLFLAAVLLAACAPSALAISPAPQPHVVFVTGDCEYRSEITMPLIAGILEKKHNMRCTVCYAVNEKTGQREPKYLKNIQSLNALTSADLAVFFVRYRQLPDDQLRLILDYAQSGKPIIGLRTTTHAFRYEDGPNANWNDDFGRQIFGQKWIHHHGHDSSTNVYVAVGDHPITRGLQPRFHCRSWLYHVIPLVGDCQPLLLGSAVQGEAERNESFGTPNPVAWTKTNHGGRVFFTTLGHPEDFANPSVRRLLVNGIYWALGRENEIPPQGSNVDLDEPYTPPQTTQAIPDPTLPIFVNRHFADDDEGNPQGQSSSGG